MLTVTIVLKGQRI